MATAQPMIVKEGEKVGVKPQSADSQKNSKRGSGPEDLDGHGALLVPSSALQL